MAVIVTQRSPKPEAVWQAARWAFGWLLRQAMVACGEDGKMRSIFERGIALDGLHIDLLALHEASRAREILLDAAVRAVNGELPKVEVEGRVLDERSQEQFRAAAGELVKLLTTK